MKKILLLFIFIFNFENSYADNKIAYIDIDYILNNSIAGQSISKHIQKLGGWITTNDISNHQADWVEPISTEYRDYTVWQCPPNTQGLNVLMALNIYEGFNNTETSDPVKELHLKIESVKAAFSAILAATIKKAAEEISLGISMSHASNSPPPSSVIQLSEQVTW